MRYIQGSHSAQDYIFEKEHVHVFLNVFAEGVFLKDSFLNEWSQIFLTVRNK